MKSPTLLLIVALQLFSELFLVQGSPYSIEKTTRECVLATLPRPNCDDLKYETLDGSCNNPLNPFSGKTWTPYKRLVPPSYGNKINTQRLASNLEPLPLSRLISNSFNVNKNSSASSQVNAMFVQFGQYIIHDLAGTPTIKETNGRPNTCGCSSSKIDCLIIPIPPHDPYYTSETPCITRQGSQTASGCRNLPAEQLNSLSAYINAETVYGWNEAILNQLRDHDSDWGALRLMAPPSKDQSHCSGKCPFHRNEKLLPVQEDIGQGFSRLFDCPAALKSPSCFVAGDTRVNENIGLSSTHLIFAREHNRIAKRLKELNEHWNSDKVFQETRRIVIAIHQSITFGEFLPPLVGPTLMEEFDLSLVHDGFYFGYDATYDATISNSFTTAAFRYGHSQVGNFFHRLNADYSGQEDPSIPLFKGLFTQEAVFNGSTPAIMRGLMVDPAKKTDLQFVNDLRNLMFATAVKPGQDLLAVNIQRGRDHGLAPYNDYREFCGLQRAHSWDDLISTIPNNVIQALRSVYSNVDDIDLYVGGIAESPLENANVGPTFGCIMGYQFRDIRKGDRFWFENPGEFSEGQLNEIRKASFSSVLCNNMDGMTDIFPRAMELENKENDRIPCSDVEQMDLNNWKEYNYHQDGVWSRWFPFVNTTKENALQIILSNEPESVCSNPLDSEVESLNSEKTRIKIRFFCPAGTTNYSPYPNVKKSLHYYWTSWFDRDTPGSGGNDVESLRYLKMERSSEICPKPLYMQAFTKTGESAFESNEVFQFLSPTKGLVCRGRDQPNGRCEDYRVRFYCPSDYKLKVYAEKRKYATSSNYTWSRWINQGSPTNLPYDLETAQRARSRGIEMCRKPLQIEGRVAGTNISVYDSGDVLQRFSASFGLKCDNQDQVGGHCRDYEVRYLCQRRRRD